MAPFKAFISLALAAFLCSCTEISAPSAPETQAGGESTAASPPLRVPIRELEKEKANNIEIIWQAPGDQAQAFIIRYGTNPEALSEEKRVEASEIETINDRDFGLVYRYVLKDLPPGRDIYVSISSIHGNAISEPSSIFQVKAEEPVPASPKNTQEPPAL